MAGERKRTRTQKSESLTIRLDPKMRFALEFVARLKGQTITKVIERAVTETADRTKVEAEGNSYDAPNWLSYWDINNGVRAINIATDPHILLSFEEEEILDFIKTHWNFFSYTKNLKDLKRANIEVLWPHMDILISEWRETKSSARNACHDSMMTILNNAGIENPLLVQHDNPDNEIPF